MDDCLFCRIAAGEIPSERVYEDETCFAIKDIEPQAPVHLLIIPKIHVKNVAELSDCELSGKLMLAVGKLARQLGLEEGGFRVVINTGESAGQSVPHLHLHLLAGRPFAWPAG